MWGEEKGRALGIRIFKPLGCAHDEVHTAVSGYHSAQPIDLQPKGGILKRALMDEKGRC